jgi:ABC-type multidrug transport system fused ATPase/permease subunit
MAVIEQEIQEKELEQLVSLAEEISSKIESLKKGYLGDQSFISPDRKESANILLLFVFFIIGLYILFIELDMTRLGVLLIIFIVGLFAGVIVMTIQLNSKKKRRYKLSTQITQEQKILGELLNMIHSYKELAYQDMSVVSRAVFEMRLNRIYFSAGDDFEVAYG